MVWRRSLGAAARGCTKNVLALKLTPGPGDDACDRPDGGDRRRRADHWTAIRSKELLITGDHQAARDLIEKCRSEVELMIPEVPAPPGG